jgi:hypothetical protein
VPFVFTPLALFCSQLGYQVELTAA